MRSVFVLLVAVCAVALLLPVAPASVAAQSGASTVWEHFPYDADVITSTAGNGPPQATLVGVGPVISNDIYRFGGGSAYNPQPKLGGHVLIEYTRATSWSFAFWLYRNTTFTVITPVLVPDAQGEFIFQLTPSQTLQFEYENGFVSSFGGKVLPLGQWSHFAVTGAATGSNINIIEYFNGEAVYTYTQGTTNPPGSKGYDVLQSGGYFFDELWIINSAINANQVQELYTSNVLP